MQIKTITIDGVECEVKNLALKFEPSAEEGTVTVRVSAYGVVDSYNDIVEKGAFDDAIAQFNLNHRYPKFIADHDWDKLLGPTLDLWEQNDGLYAKGKFTLDVQRSREAYALVKDGAMTDASFGYVVEESYVDNKGTRHITKCRLYEWSLVLIGANPDAGVVEVKSIPERKGAVADILAARQSPDNWDNMSEKWGLVNQVEEVYYAFCAAFLDCRVNSEQFDEFAGEMIALMQAIVTGEATIEEKAALLKIALEKKEGRTLSAKTIDSLKRAKDAFATTQKGAEDAIAEIDTLLAETPAENDDATKASPTVTGNKSPMVAAVQRKARIAVGAQVAVLRAMKGMN